MTSSRTSPAPPMKSEMSEVLNAIAMMGQNLQMVMSASQSNSCPGPQGFAHQPASFPSSQGWTVLVQGLQAIAVSCAMRWPFLEPLSCPAGIHLAQKSCEEHTEQHGHDGQWDPIPSDPANHLWVTQIDEYYARNPHLLPWEVVQAKILANLLKVCGQGAPKKRTQVFLPIWSQSMRRMRYSAHSEGHKIQRRLNWRYIEVLQARKNEIASGKKKMDLLKPALPKMDQLKEVPLAERCTRPLQPNLFQAPLWHPFTPHSSNLWHW